MVNPYAQYAQPSKAQQVIDVLDPDAPDATKNPYAKFAQPAAQPTAQINPYAKFSAKTDTNPYAKFAPAKEGVVEEIGRRESRALGEDAADIKSQFTRLFKKDKSAGPELLQHIGDVGGRIASVPADIIAGATSPVKAIGETAMERALVPEARRGEPKVEQAVQNAGDLLQAASLAPSAIGEAKAIKNAAGLAKELPEVKQAQALKPTQDVSDTLFRLSNKDEARRINAVKTLQDIKGVDNATWEKLYAHKDNPEGVPLTPQETALYEKAIKPVAARSDFLRAELNKKGVPFEEGQVGGAPRKVKGKNALVEKIYGNEQAAKAVGKGGKLSTYSPTLQAREIWALPGEIGKRPIVFIKDGKLFKNGEQVGEVLGKDATPSAGAETSLDRLQQATTDEAEKSTTVEYYKNLLANEYLNWQSLERANDAADFLESAKKDPQFLEHAAPAGAKVPEAWRKLNVENKAFDGWKFDPKMAEVFEDYLGNLRSPEEFSKGVMNVAKAMRASIFYDPIKHMVNATNMFGTSLGAIGGAKNLAAGRLPIALARATKSVLTQDKAFRAAMEEGLSMPGARNEANKFHQELIRAMGRSIQSDPKAFTRLAKEWGYKSSVGLMQALYQGSSKLLWAYSDILTKARYDMYRSEGLSAREAVKKTHEVMASYRVPSRVAGSRRVSQVLQDLRGTLFGRYDYNRFANLAGMVKRAAKNDKAGWEARDQLLALAAITTVGYKILDPMLQQASDEPDAHYGMGGYSSLVDIADALGEGRKSPTQAAMSAFSPGLMATPLELATGQNLYTGKSIVQRGDWNSFTEGGDRVTDAARMGYDVSSYIAEKFAPIQAAAQALDNDDPLKKIIFEQLGASFPKDSTKAEKYARGASRNAAKKRPGFIP